MSQPCNGCFIAGCTTIYRLAEQSEVHACTLTSHAPVATRPMPCMETCAHRQSSRSTLFNFLACILRSGMLHLPEQADPYQSLGSSCRLCQGYLQKFFRIHPQQLLILNFFHLTNHGIGRNHTPHRRQKHSQKDWQCFIQLCTQFQPKVNKNLQTWSLATRTAESTAGHSIHMGEPRDPPLKTWSKTTGT